MITPDDLTWVVMWLFVWGFVLGTLRIFIR